ncbi:hypothetical protein [Rufibacter sp. LB8]|nr:hypothetical protein [Rufibacter sp. LB8]
MFVEEGFRQEIPAQPALSQARFQAHFRKRSQKRPFIPAADAKFYNSN